MLLKSSSIMVGGTEGLDACLDARVHSYCRLKFQAGAKSKIPSPMGRLLSLDGTWDANIFLWKNRTNFPNNASVSPQKDTVICGT